MLRTVTSSLSRVSARGLTLQNAKFGTAEKSGSILSAWNKSCYHEMDFTIPESASVFEAVERFSAYDVGALVTTDDDGKMSGVISERDYIKKIALLERTSKETRIKDIYTQSSNVIFSTVDESIEEAMEKMMTKSIRHLPIMDGEKLVGIVSIKDLIKEVAADKEKTIRDLSDLALGKGSASF
mmetsp:Transcript_379/g.487  ORF Transcript_379/g.487 Transcript_379/m.487 type:complete len:183 (-) Transcript_379:72-620(-)|eukprot:CAMPEP_0197237772 /NCGR_PEP_ID=MMETSP1429-20130617/4511_1 /TAXON_ID=49237 /ORGANISM="Chaetoceros  sp., Strain UNC1202" /LENGTH=182 /DNA_ID=CAMNT_0042696839 /DNA_START=42 /DNA_END=590 /DNA_ORIENTATION=-